MDSKIYLEQILAYEADELSTKKQQTFNKALSEDANFKAFYDDWQASKAAQDVLVYDELRSKIYQIAHKKPVVKLTFRRYFSVAASILVLIIAVGAFIVNKNYSNEAIAKFYYESPNFSINRDATPVSNLEKAKVQFGHQDYTTVIQLLKNTTSNQALFLLAHAYYRSNSFNKASAIFENLATSDDSRVSFGAEWFHAISLLSENKTTEAKNILASISKNDTHPYQEDAEEALQLLESDIRVFVSFFLKFSSNNYSQQ